MKKCLSLLLALCLCLGMLPTAAFAARWDDSFDFFIRDGVLTDYNGPGGHVVIPDGVTEIGNSVFERINLYSVTIPDSVTKIGDSAFRSCSLKSVTIPNGVTEIGSRAFELCIYLKSVTIPDSVTEIGSGAFSYCSGLASVTIPDSVTKIGNSAFASTSLTSITIPNSVTEIGSAFTSCDNLTSVTIPGSITVIGASAFSYCSKLKSVTILDGVTKIGNNTSNSAGVFGSCTNLTSITIPNSVTSIGANTFYRCTSLTSITIPDSVTEIGTNAFSDCTGLTSITIPDSVTEIGPCAFYGCTGLTNVTIPDSVKEIGHGAFHDCIGLTSVTIPDSVTCIGDNAFAGCENLKAVTVPSSVQMASNVFPSTTKVTLSGHYFDIQNGVLKGYNGPGGDVVIPDGVTEIAKSAFSGCTSLTSIAIPDSVTVIGSNAFSGCTGLTSITIPDSVTEIGSGAFDGCNNLATAYAPSTAKLSENRYKEQNSFPSTTEVILTGHNFTIEDGVLRTYRGPGGDVTIPDGVTEIGGGSLNYSNDRGAFSSCSALTSVVIPDSVTEIGSNAFSGCTGLTSVTIPDSVTVIHNDAFSGCTNLATAYVPSSTKLSTDRYSQQDSFPSTTKLILVGHYFDVVDGVLKKYRGSGGDVVIPNSVTEIDSYAFQGCTGLTSVTIPDSVKTIGNYAFFECTGLTSVTIPDSVKTIGNSAFAGCQNLKTATLSSSTEFNNNSYGYPSFPSATEVILLGQNFIVEDGVLKEYRGPGGNIVIPNGVTEIGAGNYNSNGVFASNVTGVTIPSSVTKINCNAFSGCTGLTSITIPDSVTEIGSYAFSGCKNLKTAAVPSSTQVASGAFPDTTQVTLVGNYFNVVNGVLQGYNGPGGHVTIPGSVTVIGDKAFSNCLALTGITIPGSVISIGDYAFSGCTGLTSVTVPDSVKEIGSGAFSGCLNLTTATVPTATTLERNAFPSITTVNRTGHLFTIENGVLSGYQGPGGAITIPDGVTKITSRAFANRSDITSVTFPGSLTSIDSYAFSSCTGLKSVELASSVQVGSSAFPSSTKVNRVGSYFDVQSGVLKKYVGPGGSIAIPGNVTSIGPDVFANRADITSVTVPGSVTEIGERAFQKCTGLTSLTLGGGVSAIGGSAFEGCAGLTSVTLPDSLASIGQSAFRDCTGLTGVTLPNSVTSIGHHAFSGCTGLTSVTLNNGLTKLDSDAFRGCVGLSSLTIPGSVARLNSGTLAGCTGLTSLTVSYGVKEVSLGADDAPQLRTLSLPDSVEKLSISSNTLRELVIPAGVTSWPTLNCPRLTKLTFPKDNWVFKGISRANFMKQIARLTSLNEIVNCPNEFVDDLVASNTAIRDNWSNPRSTVVAQSNRITQLSREITAGLTTDYDKAKAISQWVISHIKYDDDYYYEGLKNYSDVPFDAEVVLDKGQAVCAGYARLTQALLVAQNIPCLYVLGWTSPGFHAWNLALIDGDYLWIDNTWGMDYFGLGVYAISTDHKATGAATFNGVKGPGTLVEGKPLDAGNAEKTSIGTALPETAEETLAREVIEALKDQCPDGMSWTNDNSYYSEGLKSTGSGCAGFAYICSDAVFGKAPAGESHSDFNKIRVGDILRINNDTHSVVVLRKMSDGVIVAEGNYNGMIHWGRQISKADLEKGGLKVTTRWGTKAQEDAAKTDIPAAGTAYPSTQMVSVDGKSVSFQCYALKDANGFDTNYIKLRDLADILNGTKAQFQVGWDSGVTITAGQSYTKNGSEQSTPFSGQRSYVKASAPTYIDGSRVDLIAFLLNDDQGGGYTYYQLRDLGQALNFNVGWSADGGIFVETNKPYDANN